MIELYFILFLIIAFAFLIVGFLQQKFLPMFIAGGLFFMLAILLYGQGIEHEIGITQVATDADTSIITYNTTTLSAQNDFTLMILQYIFLIGSLGIWSLGLIYLRGGIKRA